MNAIQSVSVKFLENNPRSTRITFDPDGPITITASSGQVTYNLDKTDGAKFALSVSPIQFLDDLGQGINQPQGATVTRLSDYSTQINLTAPPVATKATFRFRVVLQTEGSESFFRSSDPTIVIMRPA
ncbi:MAG TPA: DP-EP family protein [Thermoanaerobaculia bacterium]|jgi:hypothetical protein|nr:DP-EP family protein [Thermoanaerobaculia bacterium]